MGEEVTQHHRGEEGEEKTCSRTHYLLLQVECVCLVVAEAVVRALTV